MPFSRDVDKYKNKLSLCTLCITLYVIVELSSEKNELWSTVCFLKFQTIWNYNNVYNDNVSVVLLKVENASAAFELSGSDLETHSEHNQCGQSNHLLREQNNQKNKAVTTQLYMKTVRF